MVDFVRGTELPANLQREVKRTYVHRFTGENRPSWARAERMNGMPYPLQFSDDRDWLENTEFPVTKTGKLARRPSDCRSSPTWPDNPELR